MLLITLISANLAFLLTIILTIFTLRLLLIYYISRSAPTSPIPISVNYHFTRQCNASCAFCFHTALTSHHEPFPRASAALRLLAEAGMQKLNFAGGEPFLYPQLLGQLCAFAKQELQLPSVSIVSNGTRVTRRWLEKWGAHVDILAISCDSFDAETNKAIGRAERATGKAFDNVAQLFRIRDWCKELGIKFKLNTVVCAANWEEDMSKVVEELAPFRWKVFQVLVVEGENEGEERMRDARSWQISGEEFDAFCERHEHVKGFVPEGNEVMKGSYLILDEYLKFLDAGTSKMIKSDNILDVGVRKALGQINWDEEGFKKRGGIYDWTKPRGEEKGCRGDMNGIAARDLEF